MALSYTHHFEFFAWKCSSKKKQDQLVFLYYLKMIRSIIYYRATTVVSACLLCCFWVYSGDMWVWVIIYSLSLSSQCVGVVSGGEAGFPYSTRAAALYSKYSIGPHLLPLWDASAVSGASKSYAILVNHQVVAAVDNTVRISACFQLQISRLQ